MKRSSLTAIIKPYRDKKALTVDDIKSLKCYEVYSLTKLCIFPGDPKDIGDGFWYKHYDLEEDDGYEMGGCEDGDYIWMEDVFNKVDRPNWRWQMSEPQLNAEKPILSWTLTFNDGVRNIVIEHRIECKDRKPTTEEHVLARCTAALLLAVEIGE